MPETSNEQEAPSAKGTYSETYVTWTRVRVSDTGVDPSVWYVIFKYIGYGYGNTEK